MLVILLGLVRNDRFMNLVSRHFHTMRSIHDQRLIMTPYPSQNHYVLLYTDNGVTSYLLLHILVY